MMVRFGEYGIIRRLAFVRLQARREREAIDKVRKEAEGGEDGSTNTGRRKPSPDAPRVRPRRDKDEMMYPSAPVPPSSPSGSPFWDKLVAAATGPRPADSPVASSRRVRRAPPDRGGEI